METATFAARRLNRIADVLGETEVNKAIDELCSELAKDRDWDIFLNGSDAERASLVEEVQREIPV
jgi:hypothetical protein